MDRFFLESHAEAVRLGGYDSFDLTNNRSLVVLSVFLAIFAATGAFEAVKAAGRDGRRRLWLPVGSVLFALGTWSMHFLGMLSINFPHPMYYNPWYTGASVIPAFLGALYALSVVDRGGLGLKYLMGTSLPLGLGVALMHYTGMGAVQWHGIVLYLTQPFLISVAAALILPGAAFAAHAALSERSRYSSSFGFSIVSGVILGGAISGVHYIAMDSAHFVPMDISVSAELLEHDTMVSVVVSLTLVVLFTGLVLVTSASRIAVAQDQLTEALAGLNQGILIFNSEKKVTRTNTTLLQLLGRSKIEVIGTNPLHAMRADANPDSLEHNGRFDTYVTKADGTKIPVEVTVSIYRDHLLRLVRGYAVVRDLTERVEAEKILRASEHRFRTLLEASPDPLVISDADGRILMVNRSAIALSGYSSEQLLASNISMLMPQRFRGRHDFMQKQYMKAPVARPARSDLVLLTANGTELQVDITLSPIELDGKMVVASALRDVSERRNAESLVRQQRDELNLQAQELREITAHQKTLYDTATVGIAHINQRIIVDCNHTMERMFGCEKDELIGKPTRALYRDETGYLEGGPAEDKILATGRSSTREHQLIRKDGTTFWARLSTHAIQPSDLSRGVVQVIEDITTERNYAEAMTVAKEIAEVAARTKSEFLASMSHEIRTPLNGVLGTVDLLSHTELTSDQRLLLRTVKESGNALLNIINDILDFSKIEAGKLVVEHINLSVVQIVEGVATAMAPIAKAKRIRILSFIDPSIPNLVEGDPTRLRQILFNLIGNAVKFSAEKDVKVNAVLRKSDGHECLRFEIVDRGIGISAEAQPHLFQAFMQAESSTVRRYGGTGLGLAICKRLVELQGGQIGVVSALGRGSTFWFELPLRPVHQEGAAAPRDDLSGLKVVLLGSEGDRADIISKYLSYHGAEVLPVGNAQGLEQAMANVTAVVVDFDMDSEKQSSATTDLRRLYAQNLPTLVLLRDGQQQSMKADNPGTISLDANPLVRARLITAIAVAAHRASPEIDYVDVDSGPVEFSTAPSIEEAASEGTLILLAEDNVTNQFVISRQLRLLGYACVVVDNGKAALGEWRTGRYALLLTDCHMPEMDGYQLAAAIRAEERETGRHLPIIAATANAVRGAAEECFAAGMDDYVSKPIATPELRQIVQKWLKPRTIADDVPQQAERGASTIQGSAGRARAVVDDARIKEMFGDDDQVIREVMANFVPMARTTIADMAEATRAKDAKSVRRAAHKLKSSARTVGADELAFTCELLEEAGTKEDLSKIQEYTRQLAPQLAAVEEFIAAY